MQKLFGTDTPVLLAPMAGVTDAAFRGICREMGAGFFVYGNGKREGTAL